MAVLLLAAFFAVQQYWDDYVFRRDVVAGGELVIQVIDVGQADSIVLLAGDDSLLIDAGDGDDFEAISAALDRLGIDKLDMAVATHPHADHIGNMAEILKEYTPERYYYTDLPHDSKTYYNTMSAAKQYAGQMTVLTAGMELPFGSGRLTVLSPQADYSGAEVNNHSAVLLLEYKEFRGIFTGDAEAEIEEALVDQGLPDVDFLKVPHHGSYTSSTAAFLQAIEPEYSAISVGLDNEYGMPYERPLGDLAAAGTNIVRTDLQGDITLVYQAGEYRVHTAR